MIKKINRIKNLGLVFRDYSRPLSLSYFQKVNLIYGWNGSGKTTLTRLYDAIGGKQFPGLQYEIEDETGNKYTQTTTYPEKIRVFNQDYIDKNVKIIDSRANSISILLGEENKELVEKIDNWQRELNGDSSNADSIGKISELKAQRLKASQSKGQRETKFTDVAKVIGTAIGGSALRTYRRQQAVAEFELLARKNELSQEDLSKQLLIMKQESLALIRSVSLRKVLVEGKEADPLEVLGSIVQESRSLLSQTVKTKMIERLSSNSDIAHWVESGLKIHREYDSRSCEYCCQPLPESRINELADYFNEADRQLKDNLDELIKKLNAIKLIVSSVETPDKTRFYSNIQKHFSSTTKSFETIKQRIVADIGKLEEELAVKKLNTTKEASLEATISVADFVQLIEAINKVINEHNDMTENFDSLKEQSRKEIGQHFLSGIYEDIIELREDEKNAQEESAKLEAEIIQINQNIAGARAQISSDHKACDHINEKLTMFLGHTELQFKPHVEIEVDEQGVSTEVNEGYDILRGDSLAANLSEGEKTAIAFVHFVVHLSGDDFDIQDGIVVIDDPISSLDSNSLYQAFSFLKNAVNDAGQCFIFTHNFDFLKLLLNWQQNVGRGQCGFFMVKNVLDGDKRMALIEPMDKELRQYESEYHYLFKTLKLMRDSQDDTIARAYHIPNIARKVWDTFMMHSVPNGQSAYKKIISLKEAGYDSERLDGVYKFINDQSHITGAGFDPALVVGTRRAVGDMLAMMQAISPDHFRIIDQSTD